MWFPPYNIKFNENINTQWSDNNFIGRGEKIYTYVNTERSGTLSFTMLIDHPSVVDKWRFQNRAEIDTDKAKYEEKILRFFAGCGNIDDELDNKADQKKEQTEDNNENTDKSHTPKPTGDNIETLKIPVFFPNYYTGVDDVDGGKENSEFIKYMLFGQGIHETNGNKGYEMQGSASVLKTPIVNK